MCDVYFLFFKEQRVQSNLHALVFIIVRTTVIKVEIPRLTGRPNALKNVNVIMSHCEA